MLSVAALALVASAKTAAAVVIRIFFIMFTPPL
jgi:hypothetical protein